MVHLLEKSQEGKYIYRKAAYKCNFKWTVFTRKVGIPERMTISCAL